MATTTDPNDPRLRKKQENGQYEAYLVLPWSERAKGFVRFIRRTYIHIACQNETTIADEIAETFARCPSFYTHSHCAACGRHYPVSEFLWKDVMEKVGT